MCSEVVIQKGLITIACTAINEILESYIQIEGINKEDLFNIVSNTLNMIYQLVDQNSSQKNMDIMQREELVNSMSGQI